MDKQIFKHALEAAVSSANAQIHTLVQQLGQGSRGRDAFVKTDPQQQLQLLNTVIAVCQSQNETLNVLVSFYETIIQKMEEDHHLDMEAIAFDMADLDACRRSDLAAVASGVASGNLLRMAVAGTLGYFLGGRKCS